MITKNNVNNTKITRGRITKGRETRRNYKKTTIRTKKRKLQNIIKISSKEKKRKRRKGEREKEKWAAIRPRILRKRTVRSERPRKSTEKSRGEGMEEEGAKEERRERRAAECLSVPRDARYSTQLRNTVTLLFPGPPRHLHPYYRGTEGRFFSAPLHYRRPPDAYVGRRNLMS